MVLSFDEHGSTMVLDMMRSMSFLPGLGLGHYQHGSREFIATILLLVLVLFLQRLITDT